MRRLEDNGGCHRAAVHLRGRDRAGDGRGERLTSAGIDSSPKRCHSFPRREPTLGANRYPRPFAGARGPDSIIASLWNHGPGLTDYARLMQQAGADAIELTLHPADLAMNGRAAEQPHSTSPRGETGGDTGGDEAQPCLSAIGNFVCSIGGADGFVLFNRFYQPDIDLVIAAAARSRAEHAGRDAVPAAVDCGAPAMSADRWRHHGVDTSEQVIKYLLVGADAVMTTSALLRHGIDHMQTLVEGVAEWLDARDIESVAEIRGRMSQRQMSSPSAFQRANYIQILQGWTGGPFRTLHSA
jgi:dihydroorotate dehydrogenase (fumarate)